jgi:hypothetical protein
MTPRGEPALQRRHVAAGNSVSQDRFCQSVNLQKHEPWLRRPRHIAIEAPQRRGHEAVVGLLVVDGEDRGQQGVTGGESHRDQDSGPEIGYLDAADAEPVVQPAREGDHGSSQNEADDGKEPGAEANGNPIDDRPGH